MDIQVSNLIYPLFVKSGKGIREEIDVMPGVYRLSPDTLLREAAEAAGIGINKILLFGLPQKKDAKGSGAYAGNNVITRSIRQLKREFPGLVVMTDVCLCAYTSGGHCGVINKSGNVDNAATLEVLSKIALSHAEAGADWVAPSAMARGQVAAIRGTLDKNGYNKVKIMGYSAKYASNFYGPFRDAVDSTPAFGNRSAYQLDYSNADIALDRIADDIKQGADVVMVKPALGYLDVIKQASRKFKHPLAAYNVSGEYAMLRHGARLALWDERKIVFEIITSIRRAGADLIITYHAKDLAKWLIS